VRTVLHAEWTKLRTLASNVWLLLGIVAATVGVGAAAGGLTDSSGVNHAVDATKLSLSGVYLGQLVVATLAVVAISEEYATGMIRVTLTAAPRRGPVLLAKAAILTGVTGVAGLVAVAGELAIGRYTLPANGLDPAHGYALISLGSGSTITAAMGTVLYMALIGLFSLGIATMIRDTGVAVGIVTALLYGPALLAHIVGGSLGRRVEQLAPMTAGLAIQATTHLQTLPIQPLAGIGVLSIWAIASLLLAATALRLRDA